MRTKVIVLQLAKCNAAKRVQGLASIISSPAGLLEMSFRTAGLIQLSWQHGTQTPHEMWLKIQIKLNILC